MNNLKAIELTIVVYCQDHPENIPRCLASLKSQQTDVRFEIVVVIAGSRELTISDPCIKVFRCPRDATCGALRNAGLQSGYGDHVVFLHSSFTVSQGWINAVVRCHERRDAQAIAGAIENGAPDSMIATAGYIRERNKWLATTNGPVANAPASHASYSRAVFDSGLRFSEFSTEDDTDLHVRLGNEQKIVLHSAPELKAYYHAEPTLYGFLEHNFVEGRRYTLWRQQRGRLGWPVRLMLLAFWWLIPARFLQLTWPAIRHNKALRKIVIWHLPLLLLGWSVRALGEVSICFTRKQWHERHAQVRS